MNKYVIFVYSHMSNNTAMWQVEEETMWDAASAFKKYYPDEALPDSLTEVERMSWDAELELAIWKVQ